MIDGKYNSGISVYELCLPTGHLHPDQVKNLAIFNFATFSSTFCQDGVHYREGRLGPTVGHQGEARGLQMRDGDSS